MYKLNAARQALALAGLATALAAHAQQPVANPLNWRPFRKSRSHRSCYGWWANVTTDPSSATHDLRQSRVVVQSATAAEANVSLRGLGAGCYLLEVRAPDGRTQTQRLMVQP